MKVWVTGASGFIGHHLVQKLLADGHEVGALRHRREIPVADPRLEVIEGDLGVPGPWIGQLKSFAPKQVIHLAGAGLDPSRRNDPQAIEVNVQGTFRLLEALEGVKLRGFVLTGSCLEYGQNAGGPIPPDAPLRPTDFYGASKASATQITGVWAKENEVPFCVVRPFAVYGPGEAPYRVEYQMARALLKNEPLTLSAGEQKRDFVYIDDVVDAYQAILHKAGWNGEVYNIGNGTSISLLKLGQLLARLTGGPLSNLKFGERPYRENEIMDLCADAQALRALGWKPAVSLDEGMGRLVSFVQEQTGV